MSTSVLPLSTVVSVSISAAPSLPQVPNVNTLAIITQDLVPSGWASGQAYAVYFDLAEVGDDFGVTGNTYAIAQAFFAQQPNPLAAGGYLVVIPRLQSPSLESVVACLQRTVNLIFYFAFVIDQELTTSAPTTFAAIAAYCQANNVMFFYTSSNPNDCNPGSPLDLVRQADDQNTRCSYYGSPLLNGSSAQQTQIFAAAYAARELSVDFDGSNTVITMNLKQLVTIPGDATLTPTIYTAAQASGVDVYANLPGFTGLLTSGANNWTDEVYNQFWLQFALQVAAFDLLAGTNTKIPMTEQGMYSIKNVLATVMAQGANNGFLTPGVWPAGATVFGNTQRLIANIADAGWYIYSSPIAQQTQAQLQSRVAPLIQIATLASGAVQKIAIQVNISL
jgi:hypothetical protein